MRSISFHKDGKRGAVEVTYGTSKYPPNQKPFDLHICNLADMMACGLPQTTCFVLDRTVWLPWADDFFGKREDGTGPIIGRLSNTVLM